MRWGCIGFPAFTRWAIKFSPATRALELMGDKYFPGAYADPAMLSGDPSGLKGEEGGSRIAPKLPDKRHFVIDTQTVKALNCEHQR